jgi:hypothetical protein
VKPPQNTFVICPSPSLEEGLGWGKFGSFENLIIEYHSNCPFVEKYQNMPIGGRK